VRKKGNEGGEEGGHEEEEEEEEGATPGHPLRSKTTGVMTSPQEQVCFRGGAYGD